MFNETGNVIAGNLIGTDITGAHALSDDFGVSFDIETTNNTVGGTAAGAGNLISGNVDGIDNATANLIAGNKIGTDITGTVALPNTTFGVILVSDSTVGGTASGAGNLISGNKTGILDFGGANLIEGNLVGTNATGLTALANTQDGIDVKSSAETIGGTAAGAGNTIAFNPGDAINVITGTGDAILENVIFRNGSGIIILASGANNNQIAPVITGVTSEATWQQRPPQTSISRRSDRGGVHFRIDLFAFDFFASEHWVIRTSGVQAHIYLGDPDFHGESATVQRHVHAALRCRCCRQPRRSRRLRRSWLGRRVYRYLGIRHGRWGQRGFQHHSHHDGRNRGRLAGTGDPRRERRYHPLHSLHDHFCDHARERSLHDHPAIRRVDFAHTLRRARRDQPSGVRRLADYRAERDRGSRGSGLVLSTGSDGSLVRGFDVIDFTHSGTDGIDIASGGNAVQASYVGVQTGGSTAAANTYGVWISGSNNTIGGTMPHHAGNLISGNNDSSGMTADIGVEIIGSTATGNSVVGNLIGTDVLGTGYLPNYTGIYIGTGASGNTIGGSTTAARNVISGNNDDGVFLDSTASNLVAGNLIGTDVTGSNALGSFGNDDVQIRNSSTDTTSAASRPGPATSSKRQRWVQPSTSSATAPRPSRAITSVPMRPARLPWTPALSTASLSSAAPTT